MITLAYIELHVVDAVSAAAELSQRHGFTVVSTDGGPADPRHHAVVLRYGGADLVVRQGMDAGHPERRYVDAHGDGVADIALATDDVAATFEALIASGVRGLRPPTCSADSMGVSAVVAGFGDLTHTLVDTPRSSLSASDCRGVDHLAVCVPAGQLAAATELYVRGFGFDIIFQERIVIGPQAMNSTVVRGAGGTVTLVLIEPDATAEPGQIDGFLASHGGPGVQHIALSTDDIVRTVAAWRENGVRFLDAPAAYYDLLPQRLRAGRHDLDELRELDILVDEDSHGRLFQIFTRSTHPRRTLFFELIERRGALAFGSGNIEALYRAVTQDRQVEPLPIAPAEAEKAVRLRLARTYDVDFTATVYRHVVEHALAGPSRPAVRDGDSVLRYQQLVDRIAALREVICTAGCRPGDVVAAVGRRSATTIALFLALESIGAVYLPVDPAWPATRIAEAVRRSRASLMFTYAVEPLAVEVGCPVIALDLGTHAVSTATLNGDRCRDAAELRYMIFTSGTTGTPKASAVEHRGMINHLRAKIVDLQLDERDVVAFSAPLVFDISIWQMLAPLVVGGTVAVVDDHDLAFPQRMCSALESSAVTVAELVPAAIGWLLEGVRRGRPGERLPALRWLLSTGEDLVPSLAARVMATLPHVGLLNAYGPTECSDDVAHRLVRAADLTGTWVPVGTPVINTALYVLAPDGAMWRAAAHGEQGELFVGGVPVGPGYLEDPQATSRAFFRDVLDPASATGRLYRTGDAAVVRDGSVVCLGRLDRQVKLAGVRVELGEVEATITRHPAVVRSAVVVEHDGGRADLAAYYVRSAEWNGSPDLAEFVASRLPAATVPRRWYPVDDLPVTSNGKTDYRALVEGKHGA